jgi:hypothetical protein
LGFVISMSAAIGMSEADHQPRRPGLVNRFAIGEYPECHDATSTEILSHEATQHLDFVHFFPKSFGNIDRNSKTYEACDAVELQGLPLSPSCRPHRVLTAGYPLSRI